MNKLNNKRIAVATLAAIFVMAGVARAEGSESSDFFVDVAYVPAEDGANGSAALDCKDVIETAWFLRELARTDGTTTPDMPQPACRPEIYAESTVDAD